MKDLFARLPYGVTVRVENDLFYDKKEPYDCKLTPYIFTEQLIVHNGSIMPYLRPMSSMTEKEKEDFGGYIHTQSITRQQEYKGYTVNCSHYYTVSEIDWLNEHHFDYRGLIPMGLALEAPKDMYKTE